MSTQPNSRALFGGGPWPRPGAYQFTSADDCLAFMFGPPQHDAHVRRRHQHQWLIAERAALPARKAAVEALLDKWRADWRARVAAEAPALRAACAVADQEFEERWALRMQERAEIIAAEHARGIA